MENQDWRDIPQRVCPTCKGDIKIVGLRFNSKSILVIYKCEKCNLFNLQAEFIMSELTEEAKDDEFLRSMRIDPHEARKISVS